MMGWTYFIGIIVFVPYAYLIVWLLRTDILLLNSRSGTIASVKLLYKWEFKMSPGYGGEGNMVCILRGSGIFRIQEPYDSIPSEESLYTCFLKDNIVYFANSDDPGKNTSLCYIKGNEITFKDNIVMRQKLQGNITEICDTDLHRDTKAEDGNRTRSRCIRQGFISGYRTNHDTAEKLKEADLADCIFIEGPNGVSIFLYICWWTRAFLYFFALIIWGQECTKIKNPSLGICFLHDLSSLVLTIILPYMYKNDDIEWTSAYRTMLVVNAIIVTIYFVCFLYPYRQKLTPCVQWTQNKLVFIYGPICRMCSSIGICWTDEVGQRSLTDRPPSGSAVKDDVSRMIYALWSPSMVGIGRDAHGLNHSRIEIVDVRKMDTAISYLYIRRKRSLMKYASSLQGGKIGMSDEEDGAAILPRKEIQTMFELEWIKYLKATEMEEEEEIVVAMADIEGLGNYTNKNINEVFLLHGTSEENISSIEQNGFDVAKSKSTFLGKGLYFTESPVQADQYTEKSAEGFHRMILARILLGKMFVTKEDRQMTKARRPPCASCQQINCTENHRERRRPFDSVVLAGPNGSYREFVVYENGMAHPEYLITYKRV